MKRHLLIIGAGIALLLGVIAATHTARAATTVKKPTGIIRTDTQKAIITRPDTTRLQPVPTQTAPTQAVPTPPARTPRTAGASANYQIPWLSISSGGGRTVSPNYQTAITVGQATTGKSSSPNYTVGQGFWYGAQGGGFGCDCPHQGDTNGDGVIDVFDVIGLIEIAFSGAPDPQDPQCPKTRGDVNSDSVTDVFDVIYLITTAFSGGPDPVNPC